MDISSIGMQIRKIEKEMNRRESPLSVVVFYDAGEVKGYQPQENELMIVCDYGEGLNGHAPSNQIH